MGELLRRVHADRIHVPEHVTAGIFRRERAPLNSLDTRERRAKWLWYVVLVAIAAWAWDAAHFAYVVAPILDIAGIFGARTSLALTFSVAISVRDAGYAVLILVFYRGIVRQPLAELGITAVTVGQVALGVGLAVVLKLIDPYLFHALHLHGSLNDHLFYRVQRESTGFARALFVFTIGFFSPIVQEVYFRGSLVTTIERYAPSWAAVMMSAALFAAWHFSGGGGGPQILDTFLFGIIAAILFVRSRSLTAPCAMHIAGNCMALWEIMFQR